MKLNKSNESTYMLKVKERDHGKRVDKYITSQIMEKTRSQIQLLIINVGVFINNNIEKNCSRKVKTGDVILISIINKKNTLEPYNLKLDIVFEDAYLMVINKPSNLTVHPGSNTTNKTLANALIDYSKNLSSVNCHNRPGIVHRLDRDTSGLMLVAKNNETHFYLCAQIMARKVKRKYLALTYGVPNPVIGQIVTNLAACKKNHTKIQVGNDGSGKIAITNYRVINAYANRMFSLVECELETGRTHQIRVHMKYKSTPIVGDQKYSSYYNFNPDCISQKLFVSINELSRQALHAYKISFFHPKSFELLSFTIPMEKKIQNIINLLKVEK